MIFEERPSLKTKTLSIEQSTQCLFRRGGKERLLQQAYIFKNGSQMVNAH